jgi:hypothetical protein
MHDVFTVGVPVLAILLGILLNQRGLDKLEVRMEKTNSDLSGRIEKFNSDLSGRVEKINSDLSGRMDRINSDLSGRMDRMQADLSRFYQILGEHGGKIEMLFKK